MKHYAVKFSEDTKLSFIEFTTFCKRESTAVSRFEKVLSDYLPIYTELMLSAFMNLKPIGGGFGTVIYRGSKYKNPDCHATVTHIDDCYSVRLWYICEKPVPTSDTSDTFEDTSDTSEDTTEDTSDTSEDTTEDTSDTIEKMEDTTEPVSCLSFKWCHAPFDTSKSCYNCAFNHSCDTAIKYSFTTDNFQIVPLWVYSKYNINPLTSLIYALVKFLNRKEMYISPCLYRMIDDIIIIDDTFLSEEMPF